MKIYMYMYHSSSNWHGLINTCTCSGYYTVARRYEFYVRVARTISHKWTEPTSEILLLLWEHKIHIFELMCDVLFIIYIDTHCWRWHFWPFSENFRPLSEDFRRFSEPCPKVTRMLPNIFWKFPNTFQDCQKLSKKAWRCFDHTPTNLSAI